MIKKIQMIPPGHTDINHPETDSTMVLMGDGSTLETKMATKKRTARFTVGTSTSGWTAGDVDYLCNGTNDQIKINAAITALPATGGEIIILDGIYNITAKISVNKSYVTLSGNGISTTLRRMWDSTVSEGIISVETGANFCKARDFFTEGNKAVYTNINNQGIYLNSSYNTITGNICNGNNVGICLKSSNYNTVTGNTCNSNTSNGIYLDNSAHNTISGNTCYANNNGIDLNNGSSINTISGNICNNNTTNGIILTSSNTNTITGNSVYGNALNGICLITCSRCNVTGNTCVRGTGIVGDYTTNQYTIVLSAAGNNYNLVSSNLVMGKDVVSGGGTSNTLVNNKFA